MDYDSQLQALR